MNQPAPADPRCTCSQIPHLQACRIERERQELAVRLVEAARQRMEDRARGFRLFSHGSSALRWYFARRRRWSAPSSAQLEATTGRGSRSLPNDPRRLFAAITFAVKLAEDDAAARDGAPVGEWLRQHYEGGRSYANIAESSGDRFTLGAVRARMGRAHRLIAERLAAQGWIEGGDGGEG